MSEDVVEEEPWHDGRSRLVIKKSIAFPDFQSASTYLTGYYPELPVAKQDDIEELISAGQSELEKWPPSGEEPMDLSRFDAAPLIAFTAPKETDYGTETDRRIPPRCG
ncbi:MAG: hypothetical protein ABJR23_11545, partial [Paracoccaceae bacterium]